MSKTPLDEVRECLLELDQISMKLQDMYDTAWLLEKRSMDIRLELHRLINHKKHI